MKNYEIRPKEVFFQGGKKSLLVQAKDDQDAARQAFRQALVVLSVPGDDDSLKWVTFNSQGVIVTTENMIEQEADLGAPPNIEIWHLPGTIDPYVVRHGNDWYTVPQPPNGWEARIEFDGQLEGYERLDRQREIAERKRLGIP